MTNTTDTQTNDLIEQVARAIEQICPSLRDAYPDGPDYTAPHVLARAAVLAVRRFDAEHGPSQEEFDAVGRSMHGMHWPKAQQTYWSRDGVLDAISAGARERLRQAEEAGR